MSVFSVCPPICLYVAVLTILCYLCLPDPLPVCLSRSNAGGTEKVVANAVAALSEIGDTSGRDVMEIDTSVLQKLLAALNECTEWGQVKKRRLGWREQNLSKLSKLSKL